MNVPDKFLLLRMRLPRQSPAALYIYLAASAQTHPTQATDCLSPPAIGQ